ncbi:hypothetical protein [Agarivorans sp. DSG3-1]|uniref:hypothetical protein n=1 Tax=Agarivorans sp. DSG3-1 TaxID=3342249 RepID=UPI00398E9CCC
MLIRIFLLITVGLLLTGCASTEKSRKLELVDASICCATYDDMDFELLKLGEHSIEFGSALDVKEFAGNRSFFKAYELPSSKGKYIKVKSFISGDGFTGTKYFLPVFIALDKNHQAVKAFTIPMNVESSILTYYAAGWFTLKMLGDAKYLVTMTGDVENELFQKELAREYAFPKNQIPKETKRASHGEVEIELRESSNDDTPYWHKVDRIVNG